VEIAAALVIVVVIIVAFVGVGRVGTGVGIRVGSVSTVGGIVVRGVIIGGVVDRVDGFGPHVGEGFKRVIAVRRSLSVGAVVEGSQPFF
jgi:hypothetical protein